MICDCCDGDWEDAFFCKVCSDTPELEERLMPMLDWGGEDDDMEMQEVDVYLRSVCLNCCMGHKSGE
jgi:Fe2+ or Zn2+ uptake regulation protein